MNKTRLASVALTFALTVALLLASVAISRLANVAHFDSADSVLVAAFSTVVDALVLLMLVGALIEEWLLARRDPGLAETGVPALLIGLVTLYSLVFWLFVGSLLAWVSRLFGWRNLVGGLLQPESRLISNAIVLTFVLLSFSLLVWRYRAPLIWSRFVAFMGRRKKGSEYYRCY